MTLDLSAIRERLDAASPGPWEDGEVWGIAGVNGTSGAGRCAYCHDHGEPAWTGRTDINGTVMDAHRHRMLHPYGVGMRITGVNGMVVDDVPNPEDHTFILHARADIPALLSEVERLRALVEQAGGECRHGSLARLCGPCSFEGVFGGKVAP